jgi:hypothetical protein
MLIQAKRLPNDALYTVALDRMFDMFLSYYEAKFSLIARIRSSQYQQISIAGLKFSVVEDFGKIARSQ